jgi:hypothetical protein
MSITTTHFKLQSQAGHKARDTFEYAIWHDSLPGSTFGVLDCCPDDDYSTQFEIGVAKNSSSGIP